MKKIILLGLSLSLFFASCSTADEPFEKIKDTPNFERGILFLNEGGYGHNNPSLGFINNSSDQVFLDIAKPKGDVAQSIAFKGDKAFVVMNNSNTIEIFNRYTLKYETSISTGLNQPRYISFVNNEIYVTNYGSQSVSVYNDTNYSLITDINIGHEVNHIITSNRKIYVEKAAYGVGTEIAIIDPSSKTVFNTLDLKNTAPDPIGGLQGLVAHGDFVYAITSSTERSDFYKINNIEDKIITHFESTKNPGAQNLRFDNSKLYYTSTDKVFAWDINDVAVKNEPILKLKSSESVDLYAAFY